MIGKGDIVQIKPGGLLMMWPPSQDEIAQLNANRFKICHRIAEHGLALQVAGDENGRIFQAMDTEVELVS